VTTSSLRKLLVVPAALALALGGALLTATSASAATGDLVISTPTDGQALTSRTVTFSGTVNPDAQIRIHEGSDDSGAVIAQDDAPDAEGNWSATYTYPDTAATSETVYVDGILGGSGFSDAQARSFTIPAATPAATPFAVTSPTNNQTETSRTFAVSGTGTSGSTVSVVDGSGASLSPNLVVTNDQWSGTVTFPDSAATTQTLRFQQTTGGSGNGDISVNVTLPAAQTPPTSTFTVTAPTQNQAETSRTFAVSGTGTSGSTVSVVDGNGTVLIAGNLVVTNGQWSGTVTFSGTAATAQSLRFRQTTGGAGRGDITVNITLPAAAATPVAPAAPVITSPTNGQHLSGSAVKFTGTGTPGSNILLVVVPTASLTATTMQSDAATAMQPADQNAPIVVAADGTWSTSVALAPNDYTAEAISFLTDASGAPVVDVNGDPVVSAPSADVEFVLTAAVVPVSTTPAAGTQTAGTPTAGGLAYTGSSPAPFIGLGALLAAAGTAITFITRRRNSMQR
jgi:hypothetical protein